MATRIEGAQRDFSFGEVDVDLKRSDEHPARKAGLRQMANMRIHNSKTIQNRPGRTALFPTTGTRVEEITMTPGVLFKLVLGNALLQIVNSAGAVAATFTTQGNGAALPWSDVTVKNVIYAQLRQVIYITYPNMIPQVLSWDGVATWTMIDFAELVIGNQKRTWFYRFSPQSVNITPAGQTGSINVVANSTVFTPLHVGTRIRFVGRQLLITGFVSSTNVTAIVEESLPGSQSIGFAVDPSNTFSIGDVVLGNTSGSKGIVEFINVPGKAIGVQLLSTNSTAVNAGFYETQIFAFLSTEVVVGPGGGLQATSATAIGAPLPCSLWDEEVMNPFRGYPASCFADQFRLGFCDFPALPNGIGWSAINSPTDLYVGGPTIPNGAIFEVAPDKTRVLYVVAGPESSEFVFCDHKVYYIRIDATNPLAPGRVGFQVLSSDGSAQVMPRVSQEVILYVNAGANSVMAVIAPGAYYRPFNTKNLCEFHSHLFMNIIALAAPNADGTFNERYLYALNADGSMACGKYDVGDGKIDSVGWGPWTGLATLKWIAATNADVLFTSNYFGVPICEILDDTQYLDASLPVNNLPTAFIPPAGKGPLWWIRGQSTSLMDQVTRSMGTYQIDANGFIIPQGNAGEDLTIASLVAGQQWTSVVEPFAPAANPGADVHQRMLLRRVSRFAVYVVHSTGFVMGRLFSSNTTSTSPALGTLMNSRRFPAYNQDDDATKPPPSRETTESIRPIGRSYDPRVVLIKDTPGPLLIEESGMEVSL